MSIVGVELDAPETVNEAETEFSPKMVVVGIGGGGGNAVSHMVKANIDSVKTVCINTDVQALKKATAEVKVQIGSKMTAGLGCGADPEKGKAAAEEDIDKIRDVLCGNNIVFITAGEGGGTGTGGAPVVAQVARELGILSIAIVTKPFSYEGNKRARHAEEGIKELSKFADTIIVVPNDRLLECIGNKVSVLNAFAAANDVLLKAVRGISSSLLNPGLINLDFNDLRKCMENGGVAIIGIGVASGPNRAQEAIQHAIVSPLLEDIDLNGANSIFINVEGPTDLGIEELSQINKTIQEYADPDAEIISGLSTYEPETNVPEGEGEIRVTVVATGIGKKSKEVEVEDLTKPIPQSIQLDDVVTGDDLGGIFFKNDNGSEENLDVPVILRKQAD